MEALLLIIVIGAIYFLPTIAAYRNKHNNENAIFALNLFLGWTFLGWIAALIWSLTDNVKAPAPSK